ncbi:hypothetical protein [Acidithiobacillus sp. AMEEHan]|uniref:hypothetical protein n=1 Tax=Acidithiobacillus sp. AMEEHan TaxID=2994951 RepID=UPI0027E4CC1D|nr:hypothetical protein [Acidithiobacillus sp. AMEEHan]
MSSAPDWLSSDWLLATCDALAAQRFQTPQLREEQDLLLYLCLLCLWQLLNNAHQGDGEQFLSAQQARQLQEVDARIALLESLIPPALQQRAQQCQRSLLAQMDELAP